MEARIAVAWAVGLMQGLAVCLIQTDLSTRLVLMVIWVALFFGPQVVMRRA